MLTGALAHGARSGIQTAIGRTVRHRHGMDAGNFENADAAFCSAARTSRNVDEFIISGASMLAATVDPHGHPDRPLPI